jgi:AraC-like DNA-binding protein
MDARAGQRGLSGLPVFIQPPEYKEKRADYVFTGHRHVGFELSYIDRGPVNVLVDGAGFGGQTGDFFLLFPGQEHFFWADTHTAPNIVNACFELPGGGRGYPDLDRLRRGPVRATPRMREIVSRMLAGWGDGTARGQALAAVHLAELLLLAPAAAEGRGGRPSRRIAENGQARLAELAERFLAAHLAEPLKLATIAAALAAGESTLRHAFKRATGRTIADRLEELRSVRAKELLRESGLTVTQIAGRVGYPTIYSFSRAFKRLTGMSPSEYSRSVR